MRSLEIFNKTMNFKISGKPERKVSVSKVISTSQYPAGQDVTVIRV